MRLSQSSAKSACILLMGLLAAACGGGGDEPAASAPQNPPPPSGSSNSAPTIQGQPNSSVLAGQSYSFQPAASDADGDTLTFSATNLPRWATLNATTGKLEGTPVSADVATYGGITIQVSDGKANASLGPFSITVTDSATGSATLSWVPPTANTDGSALTLSGYQVLYGRGANDLSQTISITNPSLSSYVVENLTAGTWYFAVVAVNGAGVTSAPSNVASKTIS